MKQSTKRRYRILCLVLAAAAVVLGVLVLAYGDHGIARTAAAVTAAVVTVAFLLLAWALGRAPSSDGRD